MRYGYYIKSGYLIVFSIIAILMMLSMIFFATELEKNRVTIIKLSDDGPITRRVDKIEAIMWHTEHWPANVEKPKSVKDDQEANP